MDDGGPAVNGFTVNLDVDGSSAVIALAGGIDLSNADDLLSVGVMAVKTPKVTNVSFDMSEVTFLDSTGIGALVRIRNAAEEAEVKVRIDRASDAVVGVLNLTGLAAAFGVVDTA